MNSAKMHPTDHMSTAVEYSCSERGKGRGKRGEEGRGGRKRRKGKEKMEERKKRE